MKIYVSIFFDIIQIRITLLQTLEMYTIFFLSLDLIKFSKNINSFSVVYGHIKFWNFLAFLLALYPKCIRKTEKNTYIIVNSIHYFAYSFKNFEYRNIKKVDCKFYKYFFKFHLLLYYEWWSYKTLFIRYT